MRSRATVMVSSPWAQSWLLFSKRLQDPKKKLQDYSFRNDELLTRLEQGIKTYFIHLHKDIQLLENKLVSPQEVIRGFRSRIEKNQLILNQSMVQKISNLRYRLKSHMSLLDSLSPLNVVERGFSIATKKNKVLKSIKDVNVDEIINIRLADGEIEAQVKKLIKPVK